MNWLAQIAPTIATALGGPLAGLAVEAVSKAIGVPPEDTQKLLDSGKLNADQIAQVKLAELELQKQAQSLGLDFEKLATADRTSAREMEIATHSWTPSILTWLVVVMCLAFEGALLFNQVPKSEDPMILGRILGTLDSALMLVLAYWFGSSSGSAQKNQLLAQSTPAK